MYKTLPELKLLTLDNIDRYRVLLFIFCFHHKLLPDAISHVIAFSIQTNSQIHSHYSLLGPHTSIEVNFPE